MRPDRPRRSSTEILAPAISDTAARDTTKATCELGFDARIDLESGIRSLVGEGERPLLEEDAGTLLESNREHGSYS